MNKEEFIRVAVQSGYGSRDTAIKYAEENQKTEYTTDDFIALYHWSPHCMHWSKCASDKGLRPVFGMYGKTTAMSNGIASNSGINQDWR